jgi:hypothetical protein
MSMARITDIVARRALPREVGAKPLAKGGTPTAQQLLTSIGAYIPTEVTTAYIAAAGGIATIPAGLGRRKLLLLACAVAVLSSFGTWVIGHRKARAEAVQRKIPLPTAFGTLKASWFETLTAALAFFAWATAMPGSWLKWGANVVWGPALLVFVVSIVVGGMATLLNRET